MQKWPSCRIDLGRCKCLACRDVSRHYHCLTQPTSRFVTFRQNHFLYEGLHFRSNLSLTFCGKRLVEGAVGLAVTQMFSATTLVSRLSFSSRTKAQFASWYSVLWRIWWPNEFWRNKTKSKLFTDLQSRKGAQSWSSTTGDWPFLGLVTRGIVSSFVWTFDTMRFVSVGLHVMFHTAFIYFYLFIYIFTDATAFGWKPVLSPFGSILAEAPLRFTLVCIPVARCLLGEFWLAIVSVPDKRFDTVIALLANTTCFTS